MSKSLATLIQELEDTGNIFPFDTRFGDDIDAAHRAIFNNAADEDASEIFLKWVGKFSPCLFGRLGAKRSKGVAYDILWLSTRDIQMGDYHLITKIQEARRAWKDKALHRLSSGFLIMLSDKKLAFAKPRNELLEICRRFAELYLIKHAPLDCDTVYTESIPLKINETYGVMKAGVNVFYPSAHRTLNHDRRVPSGLFISVNSPGHLANSLVLHNVFSTLKDAVQFIYDTAMHSVGNGGIGDKATKSTSWHNLETKAKALAKRCPITHRPAHIPENYSGRLYSAFYHTDVLLPSAVTQDSRIDPDRSTAEIWPWLMIDYNTDKKVPATHLNYALFHPHPILPEALYHNPWPPRIAFNSPLFEY